MMAEVELSSSQDFEEIIENGVTLVDFNAPWCGPCRAQDPIIQDLGASYDRRVTVAKVNIDENRDIALNLGIQSIPTLILYKKGREVDRYVGLQTAATLQRALDMALD